MGTIVLSASAPYSDESAYPKGNPFIRRDIPERIAVREASACQQTAVVTAWYDQLWKRACKKIELPCGGYRGDKK